MRRRLAIRRPAFMRVDAIARIVATELVDFEATHFSARYRISGSATDPFETVTGITGGEDYVLVIRWASYHFGDNPETPLYIWDTQSLANPDGAPHLIRKFTYLLSNSDLGFYSRNEIDE